ncbi:MAG TPA: crossover junction endodeoxyribonuclease RuvC [Candidatus Paceibacterota bacterium]|nr:crossover junction endodeoxyribonuclease RuvC [Candidatus Paceibacterota bacterium]
MRVLAFDPGYERLGAAVLQKQNGKEILLYSDCIRTPGKLPFPERLKLLGAAVQVMIEEYKPTEVALEEVYFEKNAKTAMQIAEVRGMLTYIAASHGLVVHQYTPLEVKVAITGYGKSDKSGVAMMVPRLISLPQKKRLDDELDAIAVGLTCLASVR